MLKLFIVRHNVKAEITESRSHFGLWETEPFTFQ